MAKFNIENVRSLPNFAEVYKWDVQFLQLPGVGAFGFPLSQELNLRCETTEIPKASNQKIEVYQRGHKVFQPGINEYAGSLTMTFTETVDNKIHLFILAWRELIWGTKTGVSQSKSDLEAVIRIVRTDEKDSSVWSYTLKGCFLEDYDYGSLEGSSSEIIRPSITVSYDYFTEQVLSV